MHATTDIKPLAAALHINKAATKRSVLPVLAGVRVDAHADGLTLTTSDLDMTVRTTVAGVVSEPGTVIVCHADLADAASGSGSIEFSVRDDRLIAVNGLTSEIPRFDERDWPSLSANDPTEALPLDLGAVAAVIDAASSDETRPILTGVHFDGTTIVATDTYRLHVAEGLAVKYPKMLVPSQPLRHVLKTAKGDATISLVNKRRYAHIVAGGTSWTVRLIEGGFPTWQPLVRKDSPKQATVLRPAFDEVLAKLAPLARKQRLPVRIAEGSPVELSVILRDGVVKRGTVGGSCDVSFAVNESYLLDLLAGLDTCTFDLVDSLKPLVVTEVDDAGRRLSRVLMTTRVS